VSLLELLGHRDDGALNAIGIGAAAVETYTALRVETDADPASEPLHHGLPGGMLRAAGLLSGLIPLLLRLLAGRSPGARQAAAISTLIGSALTRIGWLRAGRRSAADPRVPLELPDGHGRS
jgi:hypothetical protein